jgi:cyclopropane fatty-acyl-phospholipid synthase-like methyltransferase
VVPAPDANVLEVGCGHGVLVSLLCERLTTGCAVALDRSATMVAAATRRNQAHVTAGRAVLRTTTFEDAELTTGAFDAIVAVNVRLFWGEESPWRTVRRLLKPAGRAYICYQPMNASGDDLLDRLAACAGAAGMVVDRVERDDTLPFGSVCAVVG